MESYVWVRLKDATPFAEETFGKVLYLDRETQTCLHVETMCIECLDRWGDDHNIIDFDPPTHMQDDRPRAPDVLASIAGQEPSND